jgi:hypothetical protein
MTSASSGLKILLGQMFLCTRPGGTHDTRLRFGLAASSVVYLVDGLGLQLFPSREDSATRY